MLLYFCPAHKKKKGHQIEATASTKKKKIEATMAYVLFTGTLMI
jgi:hypothetical protein